MGGTYCTHPGLDGIRVGGNGGAQDSTAVPSDHYIVLNPETTIQDLGIELPLSTGGITPGYCGPANCYSSMREWKRTATTPQT